jgi:predicted aspartyl protease
MLVCPARRVGAGTAYSSEERDMKSVLIALLVLSTTQLSAQPGPPAWLKEGPRVDNEEFAFELPLQVVAGKLLVEIELGGKPRRFVFDTGSPSMLGKQLADELGLETIDRRQGRDAHGTVVETEIVQGDLRLGGVEIHKVPIYVTEFPQAARCLFDGVLGSELLPLCAWQIDLPNAALRCDTDLQRLSHVQSAHRLQLHDFGYPHAPIFDIQLARKASSKAMFDTGASDYFVISPPDLEGAQRNKGVSNVVHGSGSLGTSAGGAAPDRPQQRVQLKTFGLDGLDLGRIEAPLREAAPSLLGAALLRHFVITLDARSKTAYFDRYRGGPFRRADYGFGLAFNPTPQVSLIWEDSPAARAGLKLGQQVGAINGQVLDGSCSSMLGAFRALSEGAPIAIESEGRTIELQPE